MFSIERWQEIFDAINKNRLRTFLTGLSVASGIFILVILLGVGEGMKNGIERAFAADAENMMYIWTGNTSKEYKGLNPGRSIQMDYSDFEHIARKHKENIASATPIVRLWGGIISYKNESGNYRVEGTTVDMQKIENADMYKGRFINENDITTYEKVVAIGYKVYTDLFKDKEDPIGKYLDINGVQFKLVGVYLDPGGEREETRAVIPVSTMFRVFKGDQKINNISLSMKGAATQQATLLRAENLTAAIEEFLKMKHTVAPDDTSAVHVNNSVEEAARFTTLMLMIRLFFWGVGICTIIAGVVGVSNIMLIIVKERTKEIGIRKALGALPWSIIGMILHESIFITAIAGFFGLIMGLGLLEIVGPFVETEFIVNPTVNFNVAVTTVFVLVAAGAIAGFFPAWKAARIKPIIALRDE